MTDYTWPTGITPSASSWRLISNTAAFVSPLTGVTRTLARGGDRWACTLTFNALTGDNRAILMAFLAQLRGQTHRVTLPDHSYVRRGALTANFLVKGANQVGDNLICDGATAGVTGAMKAGDQVTVDSRLYMLTSDSATNGSGELTLIVCPPLRSSPADNATVNITAPTGKFMLADSTVGWSHQPGGPTRPITSFQVELVEDIA